MQNYASEYVYFVYNFRNASLIFPHLFYELVYGYAFFLIAYCTRYRLLSMPLLFLKCMISGVYVVLIISVSAFGGTLAAVFVNDASLGSRDAFKSVKTSFAPFFTT